MYTSTFYALSAEAQDKIVAYNSLTDEQRESRREDALQCQMEDSWDDILEDDEWDAEYDEYEQLTPHEVKCAEHDRLREDIYAIEFSLIDINNALDILDAQVRALKGDTCTGLVPYNPARYIAKFEDAVFYADPPF